MIDQEVLDITADLADDGSRLNRIADEFRGGRDIKELFILLNSDDSELASIGAWILGELAEELYDSNEFLAKLQELVGHPDASVRFHALGALFPFLQKDEILAKDLILKIREDPNEGVRAHGEAAAKTLGLS